METSPSALTVFVRVVLATLALCAVMTLASCSFLIDKSTTQCEHDSDCHVGRYSSCELGVCVDPAAAASSGGSVGCVGATGCYRCTPDAGAEFLNACTDATCVPFDNASRLKNLTADGKLKPLP